MRDDDFDKLFARAGKVALVIWVVWALVIVSALGVGAWAVIRLVLANT